jgi:hypothetical protein
MPSFEFLFTQSKGQPVLYAGETIQMVDHLPLLNGQWFKLVFESINSDWRQGVNLTTDGGFLVNGKFFKKSIALWHDTAPKESIIQIQTKRGDCGIKNVWDTGNGVMESWHNGAAMIVSEGNGVRQYKCNDGKPDEDFNELVFRIETSFQASERLKN